MSEIAEMRALLRSDLYELEESAGDREVWVSPGRAFTVRLWRGEHGHRGCVERGDGKLVSATSRADAQWLDEVLP